ncbi:MAG: site-specific DNA-methyltransferase [Anaerolineae bacterium]|nr:site-specific DNA-methyltransferase [Anaerolineae bacterium]MDQ7036830.1 site-specific DNA-methyltransferase [Anaerolineae bacterium]
MDKFIDKIMTADCLDILPQLTDNSVHCVVSDIPYGINLDEWDVIHSNTNSALLGQSPAQLGKSGFKRRGKPIRGWNAADRNIPKEYERWCSDWASALYPKLKDGASVFIFGARRTIHRAIVALEDSGLLLRDILSWEKPNAHHRAQRISGVLEKRGLKTEAEKWEGWRLGNLAPIWEPIAWLFKPYDHTITDNVLTNEVGAIHIDACKINGKSPSNTLKFWFDKDEERFHEAQKPLSLLKFLILLTTRENQIVLDPFVGSGSTALASAELNRRYVGIEINSEYTDIAIRRIATRQAFVEPASNILPKQKPLL